MQKAGFVGREDELRELAGYLDEALAGNGGLYFVTGEAGSGKTALVQYFLQQALVEHTELAVAVGTSNSQTGSGDPYLPFREVMVMLTTDRSSGHVSGGPAMENETRLRTVVVRSIQVLVEVAPELFGLFIPGGKIIGGAGRALLVKAGWMDRLDDVVERSKEVSAEQSRIFEQYTAFLQKLSEQMPLALFLDDLQWADDASLALLFHLARRIGSCRILILGAYRPNDLALGRNGGRHPLEAITNELTRYHGDISVDLDAIDPDTSRHFVDGLIDAEPNRLGPAFRQALYQRTGGHALFTVELLRSMQERGDLEQDAAGRWVETSSLDWDALPARVEGVVEERLDRLDDDLLEMLTLASVQGEEFLAEVIARGVGLPVRDVIRRLSEELDEQHQLVTGLGLVELGRSRVSRFRFVHTLFQRYLYDDLGEAERAYLHQDVGEALEELAGEETPEVAAQLARHFEQAGIYDKAAKYRLQAGNRAWHLSASGQAVDHFIRGLELLAPLPRGPEQLQLEMHLQVMLATALVVTEGYASDHVQEAYTRARDLSEELGNPPAALPGLYGLSAVRLTRADLQAAIAGAQTVLDLAGAAGATAYALGAQLVIGAASLHAGRPRIARQQLEAVVTHYGQGGHRDLAYKVGHDPAVGALSYLSFALWILGYADQALAAKNAALELAGRLEHPYSQGYAASFAAMLLQKVGDWPGCQAQAEVALQIGHEGRYPLWQAIGGITRGYALVRQGHLDEGLADMEEGHALWHASGAELALGYQHAFLADAYLRSNRLAKAQQAVEDLLCSEQDLWWQPEELRIKAEFLLRDGGDGANAEAVLRRAMAMARQQQSRALELRAATSLAQLLGNKGRVAEGLDLLRQIRPSFTEGFGTADLRLADRLLSQAAPSPETAVQ